MPVVDSVCRYACSDHSVFHKAGYPTSYQFEDAGDGSPYIHFVNDTLENVSISHMLELIYVAIGFTVELSLYK
jgi:leucyl aminopeptidase